MTQRYILLCFISLLHLPLWGEELRYQIVYTAKIGKFEHLFLLNPDGTVKQLTSGNFIARFPSWSPDGKMIAFECSKDGGGDIFVINSDGTGMRNITRTPNEYEYYPAWSPDGREIVFECKWRLWAIDITTGRRRPISPKPKVINGMPEFQDCKARWSPDGRWITFLSILGTNFEVFICDRNGGNRINLTEHPCVDDYPAFTPDGRRIVFSSRRAKWRYSLYLLDVETREIEKLNIPDPELLAPWYPDVSPDGRKIAFSSPRGLTGPSKIYVMDFPSGRNLRRLTDTGLGVSERCPRWCPVPFRREDVASSDKIPITWGEVKKGVAE